MLLSTLLWLLLVYGLLFFVGLCVDSSSAAAATRDWEQWKREAAERQARQAAELERFIEASALAIIKARSGAARSASAGPDSPAPSARV